MGVAFFSRGPHTGPGGGKLTIGPTPTTVLGRLRAEHAHAVKHQARVAREWDRTLELLRGLDFHALAPGDLLETLRGDVEIWNELTLEPPRRLSSVQGLDGLPADADERYEYMHRVLVGLDPPTYLAMCDAIEGELDLVVVEGGPLELPELRDRLVELIELGVRCSTRSIEWLEHRISRAESGD